MEMEVKFNADYTFDRFVVGPHNNLAFSAAEQAAANPGRASFNPLYIYGKAGLGKTHLMQAIGNRLDSGRDLKVVYVTAEEFTNELISTIRNGFRNASLMEHFRIRTEEILGKSRKRNIVYPRQLAMYLSRELTDLSEAAIGDQLGGRDHSTVVHSIRVIDDQLKMNAETFHTVEVLRGKII